MVSGRLIGSDERVGEEEAIDSDFDAEAGIGHRGCCAEKQRVNYAGEVFLPADS